MQSTIDLDVNHQNPSFIRHLSGVATITLCCLGLIFWLITGVKTQAEKNITDTLNSTLTMANEAINIWYQEREVDSSYLVDLDKLASAIKKQLMVPPNRNAWLTSPALAEIDAILLPTTTGRRVYTGYMVLNPEGVIIASYYKVNVGNPNPVTDQIDIIKKAMLGEFVVTRPFVAKIRLPDSAGNLVSNSLSMLSISPIKDETGKIIALFCLRFDPSHNFSRITKLGRTGNTGETYAFDKSGKLMTESRFDAHLVQAGLISKGQRGSFLIEIRDPGGDMTQGFLPTIPRKQQPLTYMAADAIAGNSGVNVKGYRNYRGVKVVGAWLWNQNFQVGITTELDWEEAYQPYIHTRNIILLAFNAIAVLLFLIVASINKSKKLAISQERAINERTLHFKALFEHVLDGIITIDTRGIIMAFNPAAERLFGYRSIEVLGKNISLLMPSPYRDEHDKYLETYLKTGKKNIIGANREVPGLRKDGSKFDMSLNVSEMFLPGKKLYIGSIRDITRKNEDDEAIRKKTIAISLLQGVAVASNESMSVEEALTLSLKHICRTIGWPVGHVYAKTTETTVNRFHSTSAWHIEDPVKYQAFKEITDKTTFEIGIGLPGRVWASGKPEWIIDVTKDENFPRALNHPELGVRAGFAFPACRRGEVIAVLEFFFPEPLESDKSLLAVAHHMGDQLGHLLARKKSEKELRLAAITFEGKEAIIITDIDANILRVNNAFQKISGYHSSEVIGKNARILKSGRHDKAFYDAMWDQLLSKGEWEGEIWDRRKNGEVYPKLMTITAVKNMENQVTEYVAVFRVVTK